MFKKILPIIAALALAGGILLISCHRIAGEVKPSFAAAKLQFTVAPSPEPTPTLKPKVNYFLPYPGVLPDSPLYKVKMVRDRLWLWLTTQRVRRTELLLLYADKRIGAGKVLIEGNKVPLGVSTLIKGEKYLEQALSEASLAKESGSDINRLKQNLKNASLKYEEVLLELKEQVSSDGKDTIDSLLKTILDLQKKADTL